MILESIARQHLVVRTAAFDCDILSLRTVRGVTASQET